MDPDSRLVNPFGRSSVSFMPEDSFPVVRTTRTVVEADMLVMALKQAGFHPLEPQTFGHVFIGGADIDFKLRVPAEESAAVREFLIAFDASGSPTTESEVGSG